MNQIIKTSEERVGGRGEACKFLIGECICALTSGEERQRAGEGHQNLEEPKEPVKIPGNL